jgi:hypothetical protein
MKSSEYDFYVQRYSIGNTNYPRLDLEEEFNCLYGSFKGLTEDGDIKTYYSESYPEKNGARVWVSNSEDDDDVAHETTSPQLRLLFNQQTCLDDSDRFFAYCKGRKIEYYDTFRKRYATLVLHKTPTLGNEVLYGDDAYREVTYTFENIYGRVFKESQIYK